MDFTCDSVPSMLLAHTPSGKVESDVRVISVTLPWLSAITWKGAPNTAWSGWVAYMPTGSPGVKPKPSNLKVVPLGPQVGVTVWFWLAGIPEQSGPEGTVLVGCGGTVGVGGT